MTGTGRPVAAGIRSVTYAASWIDLREIDSEAAWPAIGFILNSVYMLAIALLESLAASLPWRSVR